MDLLNTIQDEVMKQKEEATQNNFERVADFRDFISGMQPEAGVTVTLKLCCISAERVNGGRGIRFTGIDASQRAEFEPTMNALADLTPLKKKPFIAQVTVWDAKAVKGSYAKANLDFHPGAVYVFRKVDGVGFYAEIAKGTVQYERGVSDKVFEAEPPLKKRKLDEAPKKAGKTKATATPSCKRAVFPASLSDDICMSKEERSKRSDSQRA